MKKVVLLLSVFLSTFSLFSRDFDYRDIPVQDGGRIKPLDTFARNQLLSIYGKRSLKSEDVPAIDWLIDLLADPHIGFKQKVFKLRNPEVVQSLGLEWDNIHTYSYHEILDGLESQRELLIQIHAKPVDELSIIESQLKELHANFQKFANMWWHLKIIPPISDNPEDSWISPWEVESEQALSENQRNLLFNFLEYLNKKLQNDTLGMDMAMSNYYNELNTNYSILIDSHRLKLETWYNEANMFYISLAFYILAFLLLGFSWVTAPILLKKIAYFSLIIGFLLHGGGLCLRMYIMQRPPVTTLYESIIFVSFIANLCAIILEYIRKDGLGIFIGSISGAIFHYIGFKYSVDGDTMGMLVAVLNSNFWLATHVTTITIGYGTSLMAGFMGHIYLGMAILYPERTSSLKEIYNNTFGITLMALFFSLFGTILGGIWADQSWGRFWGWDPKENGAMLICMWHLMMIHMRLSGMVKGPGFALGMVLNNIIVALAWFGVNLLSVGLHSYGFASGIAINLGLFILFEFLFGIGAYFWANSKQKIAIK
ncbi:MAG: cytochrome c biogenesis protein CcsA [Candidatus Marinimicrobia bacterium]|jgi:ABC-type transport system involved in cytochrome c biogenesis permease subunit|nr:cytochrome c biogenesis protein CcsA [Candidatus Neomarinimicrobiota bacterium]MBT5955494.1 cytochrome c biogenesis protein CcsA [Candidatus Neomarinimicrobiota bacterium]MBT6870292.1 cytochrome c biogenesis protein CcsA [Candidatus Neomarinimicrobiota bacterium]MBT7377757.1 cytochrome c biogenesis protein CcsA [Candidatus Neomarinimicrobiota bacterium]|tara:strand:+ start:7338 stop:8957 length:1620 start_codon:yes stop_codon:yes gene_type:complete